MHNSGRKIILNQLLKRITSLQKMEFTYTDEITLFCKRLTSLQMIQEARKTLFINHF